MEIDKMEMVLCISSTLILSVTYYTKKYRRNTSISSRSRSNNTGDDREHRIYVSYTNGRRTRYHRAV